MHLFIVRKRKNLQLLCHADEENHHQELSVEANTPVEAHVEDFY